jgi:hypothetical protein
LGVTPWVGCGCWWCRRAAVLHGERRSWCPSVGLVVSSSPARDSMRPVNWSTCWTCGAKVSHIPCVERRVCDLHKSILSAHSAAVVWVMRWPAADGALPRVDCRVAAMGAARPDESVRNFSAPSFSEGAECRSRVVAGIRPQQRRHCARTATGCCARSWAPRRPATARSPLTRAIRGAWHSPQGAQIRPASLDEIAVIAEEMPEQYRAMVLLAAWCALRFGELTELRRRDIIIIDPAGLHGVVRIERAVVRVSRRT